MNDTIHSFLRNAFFPCLPSFCSFLRAHCLLHTAYCLLPSAQCPVPHVFFFPFFLFFLFYLCCPFIHLSAHPLSPSFLTPSPFSACPLQYPYPFLTFLFPYFGIAPKGLICIVVATIYTLCSALHFFFVIFLNHSFSRLPIYLSTYLPICCTTLFHLKLTSISTSTRYRQGTTRC